jgi:hypothetical protein
MTALDALDSHGAAVGRFAWWSAWFGLVAGQLHALSRFATEEGRSDLEYPLVRAWAEPAADRLRPLLDWADPDLVYVMYGKIWLPVFLGFFLCALVVHRRRQPRGFEKAAWRVVLVGYGWAVVGVALTYWTQWVETPGAQELVDLAFLFTVPALLLTLVGSTVLGFSLVRNGLRPRAAAWLLLGALPLALAITEVTSLGSAALPVMFAFALLGRELARPGSSRTGSSRTGHMSGLRRRSAADA